MINDIRSYMPLHTPAEVLDYALKRSGYAAFLDIEVRLMAGWLMPLTT